MYTPYCGVQNVSINFLILSCGVIPMTFTKYFVVQVEDRIQRIKQGIQNRSTKSNIRGQARDMFYQGFGLLASWPNSAGRGKE
ncbi:hypothetical protein BDV28DRAFT_137074 [Aspergillus coremiiformis]|uniref:Uncharacterized protein n=1 Tax=Aspergillus coremiiformis TaxID=138285 RepID=A0A5N6Z168_9EURO|nr:hypothetical protein BDV28DRAFT_137074 [Aspergillus coremiiformis]